MTLSEELKWRGFVNQTTFSDLAKLDHQKWTFYGGFDASADSQTVGNLAFMMLNRLFMRHGHKAIMLVGGATSLIGDPGGKDAERPLQDDQTIKKNVEAATTQLKATFSGCKFELVNNLEWYRTMNVLEFLRDVGKHFSITPLIQRDYIATRVGKNGSGISYTEFSYTLLQGYDFLHLHQKHGVDLQLAGSDQWGNALSGVELVRKVTGDEVQALTMPLIIDQKTGQKFGKSQAGAVWLDPKKTSPNDFYQFWINVDDDSVSSYLKIFTELSKEDIGKVMSDFEKDKSTRLAQKTLAYEVTKLVHGKDQAERAQQQADKITSSSLNDSGTIQPGDNLVDALVKYGLASSKSEARQLIDSGGIYINNQQARRTTLDELDFEGDKVILRRGKTLRNTVVLKRK